MTVPYTRDFIYIIIKSIVTTIPILISLLQVYWNSQQPSQYIIFYFVFRGSVVSQRLWLETTKDNIEPDCQKEISCELISSVKGEKSTNILAHGVYNYYQ